MDRKVAKEFLHIRDWLDRCLDIVTRGHDAYASDALLQEAGDSLMMKLGEASGRLARANVEPPAGVAWADAIANRNWLIHQYDEIDRALTWVTLSRDLLAWRAALTDAFTRAHDSLAQTLASRDAGLVAESDRRGDDQEFVEAISVPWDDA